MESLCLHHYEELSLIQSAHLERRRMENRQGQQPQYQIFFLHRVHPPKGTPHHLRTNLPDKEASASRRIWTAGRNVKILQPKRR